MGLNSLNFCWAKELIDLACASNTDLLMEVQLTNISFDLSDEECRILSNTSVYPTKEIKKCFQRNKEQK